MSHRLSGCLKMAGTDIAFGHAECASRRIYAATSSRGIPGGQANGGRTRATLKKLKINSWSIVRTSFSRTSRRIGPCLQKYSDSLSARVRVEAGHFALGFAQFDLFFEVLALVRVGFPLADADLDFDPPAFPIHAQQRQ